MSLSRRPAHTPANWRTARQCGADTPRNLRRLYILYRRFTASIGHFLENAKQHC
jgi:hypothetical protein